MKSLCSVDALYLVFSTASAEDNIRNPRSESGISYIGSNAHSLAERGASASRVWTPAGHKLVVLHDKRVCRILSPRGVIFPHKVIAQCRSVGKSQHPVRLLKCNLFYKVQRSVLLRQKYANMPDKQQRFLLGRLIVEEYRDEADPFILPKGNAAGSPFLLYGLYMTLYPVVSSAFMEEYSARKSARLLPLSASGSVFSVSSSTNSTSSPALI